jgi:hypothetical protein
MFEIQALILTQKLHFARLQTFLSAGPNDPLQNGAGRSDASLAVSVT